MIIAPHNHEAPMFDSGCDRGLHFICSDLLCQDVVRCRAKAAAAAQLFDLIVRARTVATVKEVE